MTDEVYEKVDLPNGGWVSFRDPASLTRRDRLPVKRASTRMGFALREVFTGDASAADLPDDDIDLMWAVAEVMVAVLATEWSLDGPVSVESIQAIEDEATYEALIAAVEKYRPALFPNFEYTGERTDAAGEETPTGGSPD